MAALTAALTISTVPGIVFPASAQPQPPVYQSIFDACRASDLVLLGARGSGEPQTGTHGGLGATVHSLYTKLAAAVSPYPVGAVAVSYPARPVETIVSDLITGKRKYFEGLDDGVRQAVRMLKIFRDAPECSGVELVIAGYSQGAMVWGRALQDETVDVAELEGKIALIANGDREAAELVDTTQLGGARAGSSGIGFVIPSVSGTRPYSYTERGLDVYNICFNNDIVCSPKIGAVPKPFWCSRIFNTACTVGWAYATSLVLSSQIAVHTSYTGKPVLDDLIVLWYAP